MRLLVTGGSGFLGRHVAQAVRSDGGDVTVVTRRPDEVTGTAIGWNGVSTAMPEIDAVVNFAGASITHRRWTRARKEEILTSRVESTRAVVEAIAAATRRPAVLVSASAVGVYGSGTDDALDEAAPVGSGFLADVFGHWESAALRARTLGVRVVILRFGVVLGADGGVLPRMLPIYRAGLGGALGRGTQWLSWIHRDDAVGLVRAALVNGVYDGPVNAVSPQPRRQRDFAATLGRVVRRPARLRMPAFILRAALGEMAATLLTGQRVLPTAATGAGFSFRHPDLADALRACMIGRRRS